MALSQHSEIVLHHDGPQPPELNCLTLALGQSGKKVGNSPEMIVGLKILCL